MNVKESEKVLEIITRGYMAKSPLVKAKNKAWNAFSRYIRRKYANRNGQVKCVTCPKTACWEKEGMQAGHFIDGRNNTVLFDERLVYPQCYHCNVGLKGNKVAYTLFMLRKGFSQDEIDEFLILKNKVKKMSIADFQEIEQEYEDKLVALDIKNGDI